MKDLISTCFFGLVFLFFGVVNAQETSLMVRVQAKDAKFVGSSIGGAKVIVKDALTGEILASGITDGSTGNTKLIMQEPKERGKSITDASTAGFNAQLNIEKPTFVTVEAYAPINKKQATVKSSTQLWIIPGKDITGDGIILEVSGFVVDILSPQTHERIGAEKQIDLTANVVMMCGCPVTKGGLWDANKYEVKAIVSKEGKIVSTKELKSIEKESTFSTNLSLPAGNYEVAIYAFDPETGNTGLDKVNIIVN